MNCAILLRTVTEIILFLLTHQNLDSVVIHAPVDIVEIAITRFEKDWEIHRVIGPEFVQVVRK